jgi:hypothetical protein
MAGDAVPMQALSRALACQGEARANAMRLAGIAGFYAIELVDRFGVSVGPVQLAPVAGVDERFHLIITGIALAWCMVAVGVWFCLQRRVFFDAMKFVTTGIDLLLATLVLLAADGPGSPLGVLYPLAILVAALRFSLPLVWMATAGAVVGYLALVANAHWWRPGLAVPHHHAFIVVVALVLTGVVCGQLLRTVRAALAGALAPDGEDPP